MSVTAPSRQRGGESLTLTCSVTAVRGITSRADIIWRSGGVILSRSNSTSPIVMGSSLVYTDHYDIPCILNTFDDGMQYQCEVVINTSLPVNAANGITLDVMGEFEKAAIACIIKSR